MNNNNKSLAVAEKISIKKLLNDETVEYVTEGNVEITLSMDILRKMVKVPQNTTPPTDADMLMFAYTCVAQGLNPYLQECWLSWLGQRQGWTPLVAAQSRIRKAQAQPDYDGYEWGWIGNDGTRYKSGLESKLSDPKAVIGAWGCIYRKEWSKPFYHEVFISEYIKTTQSGLGTWEQRPITMLLKVIRDQTHKFAYADKMGNLMTENEAHYVQNDVVTDDVPKSAVLLEGQTPESQQPKQETLKQFKCPICGRTYKYGEKEGIGVKCECGKSNIVLDEPTTEFEEKYQTNEEQQPQETLPAQEQNYTPDERKPKYICKRCKATFVVKPVNCIACHGEVKEIETEESTDAD